MTTPKTTPTGTNEESITLDQLRAMLRDLHARIDGIETGVKNIDAQYSGIMFEISDLRKDLESMRDGLQAAASQRPAASEGAFIATVIEYERTKGKDYFRMIGPKYPKHGVRVWPEVLEAMGFQLAELAAQDQTPLTPPLEVRVELRDFTDKDGVTHQDSPRKVLGLRK